MLSMRKTGVTVFSPMPPSVPPRLSWPTLRRDLFTNPEGYFAKTRANPQYGLPGWTRDCGRRFHRGCDIAPVEVHPAGRTVEVMFSDCGRNVEYPSREPALIPFDRVFAVAPGRVAEINLSEDQSDFGLFVVVEHAEFFTLYGHLASIEARAGAEVSGGARIGAMGATSRDADARNWMAIAPHAHFEVIAPEGGAYDPREFLMAGLK